MRSRGWMRGKCVQAIYCCMLFLSLPLAAHQFKSESLGLTASADKLDWARSSHLINEQQIFQSGEKTLIGALSHLPGISEHKTNLGYSYANLHGLDTTRRLVVRLNGWWLKNVYSGHIYWNFPANFIEALQLDSAGLVGRLDINPRQLEGFEADIKYGFLNHAQFFAGYGLVNHHITANLMGQVALAGGPQESTQVHQVDGAETGGAIFGNMRIELQDELRNEWLLDVLLLQRNRGGYIGPFGISEPGSLLSSLRWQSSFAWRVHPLETFRLGTHFFVAQDYVDNQVMWGSGLEQRETYRTLHMRLSQTLEGLVGSSAFIRSSIYWQGFGVLSGSYFLDSSSFGNALDKKNRVASEQNENCGPWGISQKMMGQCRMSVGAIAEIEYQLLEWFGFHAGLEFEANSDVEFLLANLLQPSGTISFQLSPGHSLWAHYHYAIRPPSLEQKSSKVGREFLTLAPGQFFGNFGLKPERIHHGEIGWRFEGDMGSFFYEMQSILLAGLFEDPIDTIDHHGDINFFENEASVFQFGAQGSFKIHFSNSTNIYGSLAWSRVSQMDTYTVKAPQMVAQFGSNIGVDDMGTIQINLKLLSERRNNVRVPLEVNRPFQIPAQFSLDLFFTSKPIWKILSLQAGVRNLMDVARKDPNLRPDRLPSLIPRESVSFWLGGRLHVE